jgi:hypothetical protein
MRRREFIAGLGSAAVLPRLARAQQSERMRRVGFLTYGSEIVFQKNASRRVGEARLDRRSQSAARFPLWRWRRHSNHSNTHFRG